jgi:hypothetical protein
MSPVTQLVKACGNSLPHGDGVPLTNDCSSANLLGYVSGRAVAVVSLDLQRHSPYFVFGRRGLL